LRIKKLHLVSTVGYVPYERRNNPALRDVSCNVGLKARVNGSFSLSAIQVVRKNVLAPNLLRGDVLNTPKKIFIKRSGEVRRLINQSDIEALLHRLGFVAVAPEEMSFKEQAILFSSATHIVGPTGAALVNCIFCQSGTKICVLMGNHPDMIFGYWAKILSPLEIEVISYFGNTVKNSKRGIHADFAVDILKFEDFLLSSFL
jgi:capsular polysaccharide biosynthesis protein